MDSNGLHGGIQVDLNQTEKKPPSGNHAMKSSQNQKFFDGQGAELSKEQLAKRQALSAVP